MTKKMTLTDLVNLIDSLGVHYENERFALGQIVATPGALEAMKQEDMNPVLLLSRHVRGDWGDLDEEDKRENDLSVKEGFRILSAYGRGENRLWVITEADRSVTTILRPDEY